VNTSKSPLVIPFAFPGIDNVGCHFGTRIGGYSADPFYQANVSFDQGDDDKRVLSNRDALMKSIGFAHWQEVRQVHGTTVVFDPEPAGVAARSTVEADGLATARPGQALIIKTADCQPIFVAHKGGRHVLALHCGWRGNVAGFPTRGVAAFCEKYGLDPADCSAVRGPSLCPAHAEFTNFDAEFGPAFADYFTPDTKTVDLWQLTRDQLQAAGIKERNIYGLDLCTYSLVDFFFCYRKHNKTGRQASIIWIRG
jgi:YfiH family protein